MDMLKIAKDVLGLFFEYRDVHGCDEGKAVEMTLLEVQDWIRFEQEAKGGDLE